MNVDVADMACKSQGIRHALGVNCTVKRPSYFSPSIMYNRVLSTVILSWTAFSQKYYSITKIKSNTLTFLYTNAISNATFC